MEYVASCENLEGVPLRAHPSTKAQRLGTVPKGRSVTVAAALGEGFTLEGPKDQRLWILRTHPLLGDLLTKAADYVPPPVKPNRDDAPETAGDGRASARRTPTPATGDAR